MTATKSSLWKSGHEGAFIALNFLRYSLDENWNDNIEGDRKLNALSEYEIIC